MKKILLRVSIMLLVLSACNNDSQLKTEESHPVIEYKCLPQIISCDSLPRPIPLSMEYSVLPSYKLELSVPGEPLYTEFSMTSYRTSPLINDSVKAECEYSPKRTEIKFQPKDLKLPLIGALQHPTSERENGLSFLSFGKMQGMLHDAVNDITKDKFGNLLIANEGGLSIYNGVNLQHYTISEGLSSEAILTMYYDSKGRIWLGSFKNGIDLIDSGRIYHFGQDEGFLNTDVLAIAEDRIGNIWIGTTTHGLWKFDGENFISYQHQGCSLLRIEDIIIGQDGNVWIAGYGNGTAKSQGGVDKFDGKCFYHFTTRNGLPSDSIRCMAEDHNHQLWLGTTSKGLIRFDGNSFQTFDVKDNLLSNGINCIKFNSQNELWVGHENGITVMKNNKCRHYTANSGLPSADVREIFEDDFGQTWIGTRSGGFAKFCGNRFNHYSAKNGILGDIVYCIAQESESQYWIGTGNGLGKLEGTEISFFEPSKDFQVDAVRCVNKDKQNRIWTATTNGLLVYDHDRFKLIDQNIGVPRTKQIYKVLTDNSGNKWIGTRHGVSKYDEHFIYNYNAAEMGFPAKASYQGQLTQARYPHIARVYDIDQDAEGNLWFTVYAYGLIMFDGMAFTHYNISAGLPTKNLNNLVIDDKNRFWISADIGLLFFQPEKQTFRLINEQDGLSNSSVQAIDIDPSKNLWIGTRKGLNLLDPNEQDALAEGMNSRKIAFKKYLFDDGMIGIGVSRGAMLADSSGKIWTGGNNYLSVHLPEFQRPEKAAAVTITGLDLFNDKISWKEILNTKFDTTFQLSNGIEINGCRFDSVADWSLVPLNPSFKYNNNFLTFNFVGITTYQPEQVQYQYILEGWDDTWSGVTSRTSAPYGNLPPGDYTFKVKAINSSGIWSEPAAYKFEIRPPWFWNIWSKLGYLIAIILASIVTFRWRTSEFRKRQRELEDTVRERTSEIAKKHREITDSINYAERIQRSLMASRQLLAANLPEYFVYFNPKERVSGDFFWACNLPNGKFALTCADSTGHGVPGAIMSMLNIAALERAVEGEGLTEPNLILDSARKKVIKTLAQDGSEEGGRDGMDAVLVSLDMSERKMTAALANMQVWIMGSGEKRTLAPDKMPVGKHDKQDIPFTRHEVQLNKGDVVYMFSDGYVDQFGGPNGKKFKYRPFEELLFSIHQLPLKEQQVIIRMHFENWRGDLEQVDDVCVIGIRM